MSGTAAFENVFATIAAEAMGYFMKNQDEEKDVETLAIEFTKELEKGFGGSFKMKKRSSTNSSDLPPGRKRVHKRAEGAEACQAMTKGNKQCSRKHQEESPYCKTHEKDHMRINVSTEEAGETENTEETAPAPTPAPVKNSKKRPLSSGMMSVMKKVKRQKTVLKEDSASEDSDTEDEKTKETKETKAPSAFDVDNVVSDDFTVMTVDGKEYHIDNDGTAYTMVKGESTEVGSVSKDGKTINFNEESDDEDDEEEDFASANEGDFGKNMTF